MSEEELKRIWDNGCDASPAVVEELIVALREARLANRIKDASYERQGLAYDRLEKRALRFMDALEYCASDDPMAVDPENKFDASSANEWKKIRALDALRPEDARE